MKKRRGFTLIELVIVVAILGVLSSIALVKYTDVSDSSKKNSDYVTASNIATAAKLALNEGKNINKDNLSVALLNTEGYLEGEPKPQSTGKVFLIELDSKGVINIGAGETISDKINDTNKLYPKY